MHGLKKGLSALALSFLLITHSFAAFETEWLGIKALNASDTDVGITITMPASQAEFVIQLLDSGANDLYHLWPTGHISNLAGINSESAQYGTGMLLHNYNESIPQHTDVVGSYDHTGGTQESLFTRTAGSLFTQADADGGTWLISLTLAGTIGGTAEIKSFIDSSNVIVDGCNWDQDMPSQTWGIFYHPVMVLCDGNEVEFSVGSDGKFEIYSYNFTGPLVAEVELKAAANTIDGLVVEVEANGYNTIIGQRISYESGALAAGEVGANQVIVVDDSEAAAADATTQIAGSVYITSDASAATKDGIVFLPGWTRAIEVQGAESEDPDYGYEVTSGTATDRVNSGGAGDDAFVNPAVDVELFDSNGDYILIGSTSTFEIIQVVLDVASSKDLEFIFWYSVTGGSWTAFPVGALQADNTVGFSSGGSIVFLAASLIGWTADDEDPYGNAITNGLYIALQRTYAPVVGPNLPTESFFKTFASQDLGCYIRGDGVVKLPYVGAAPGSLVNGMMWMESDGLHIYHGGGETTLP